MKTVQIFKSSSQQSDFLQRNCDRCKKSGFFQNPGCEAEVALMRTKSGFIEEKHYVWLSGGSPEPLRDCPKRIPGEIMIDITKD